MTFPFKHLLPILLLISFPANTCTQNQQQQETCDDPLPTCDPAIDNFPNKITIDYANKTLTNPIYKNTYIDLTIRNAQDKTWNYRLIRCGCPIPNNSPAERIPLFIPPKSVFVLETPTLSLLAEQVPVLQKVKAVASRVYNKEVNDRIDQKLIQIVGKNEDDFVSVDYGLLKRSGVALSLLGASEFGGWMEYEAANVTIPYFVIAESEESSPLARAEYVKVVGMLFDKAGTAKDVFGRIQRDYEEAKSEVINVGSVPSVLLGLPYQGNWSQTGGDQYIAQFLRDANVDYLFMDDGKNDSNTLPVDETVKKFRSARYWIHVNNVPGRSNYTIDKFLGDVNDSMLLRTLASVRCGNVWLNMKRLAESGKINDFFESAIVRPDLVLRDLVAIFHPSIADGPTVTYSYNLEKPQGTTCPYNKLPTKPSAGKASVTFKIQITGASRFAVEDEIVAGLAGNISDVSGVPVQDQEFLFEGRSESSSITIVTFRALVSQNRTRQLERRARGISQVLQNELGNDGKKKTNVTVLSTSINPSDPGSNTAPVNRDSRLSAGAIAGIVLGSIALAILSAIAAWVVAYKRGRDRGYKKLRQEQEVGAPTNNATRV